MKIVLISGLSGSGKTVALHLLEDAGFYCVDNLLPPLLPELVNLLNQSGDVSKLGVVMDIRSNMRVDDLVLICQDLRQKGHSVDILFLEANESVLLRRFSETRRAHPLSNENITLEESLKLEWQQLQNLREHAYCLDTSLFNAQQLRHAVSQWINQNGNPLQVTIESFGFKYGMLNSADFLFDVRCLPNPYYQANLRPFTGKDQAIRNFFADKPMVVEMIDDIEHFLRRWLPQMQKESRSYVRVGIGCTGGQHRSVFISEELAKRLSADFAIVLRHRQLAD